MSDARIRTAVLACQGDARDRIVEGLGSAGADVVGVIDPAIADPQHVRELDPGAIVVALEPAIEDALERYASVLSDPAIIVIFEEASIVIERTGWDAARWVRHLAAKLRRDVDVLPPSLQPIETDDADNGGDAEDGAVDDGTYIVDEDAATPVLAFSLEDMSAAVSDAAVSDVTPYAFDPVSFEHDDSGVAPTIELDPELGAGLALVDALEDETSSSLSQAQDDPVQTLGLDAAIATWSLSASDEDANASVEVDATDARGEALERPADLLSFEGADDAAAPVITSNPGGNANEVMTLSLADDDADALPSFTVQDATMHETEAAPNTALHRDLDALETRISGLSLTDTDSYGHGPEHGAVLVEGGLGGPDAVRQLLAAIPEGFPRPILVRLHLDGGRYDRLVRQMERATALPVSLAEAGNDIAEGEIHFVSPDLDIVRIGGRLRFVATDGPVMLPAALPADDSAVLFLSGSDAALVDAAMGPAWAGALVAGQSPAGCYDPAAAEAAIARGSASGTPGELAEILVARWMPAHDASTTTGGLSL